MDFKVQEYSIYSSGRRLDASGRPVQEDCIYPAVGHASAQDRTFVVCDGMGQNGAGIKASSCVCQTIAKYIDGIKGSKLTSDDLIDAIDAAYDALDRVSSKPEQKIGTTLAMLVLYDKGYMTAHMGDSRVYHIRPGLTAADTHILFVTESHTLVNHLVKKGEMTPEEALTSPKRRVITRAMQPNMTKRCHADIHESADVRAGDYFLLCTDGLMENLNEETIKAIFSANGGNAKNKAALLAKATKDNNDNHSAIIVHVTDVFDRVKPSANVKRDTTTKDKSMNKKQISLAANNVTKNVRNFVNQHKANGDMVTLMLKFLFLLMGLLTLIMLIYYLFIHTDETLQTAGTADYPDQQYEEVEVYGYEITEQDLRNAAPVDLFEEETPEEEEEDAVDTNTDTDEPISTPTEPETPSPQPVNDEPILQL